MSSRCGQDTRSTSSPTRWAASWPAATFSTHADAPVERMITIGAPWLGAPRLVDVLQTGNFAAQPVERAGRERSKHYRRSDSPPAHQLAAGAYYPEVATLPIPCSIESGWDINGLTRATPRCTTSMSSQLSSMHQQALPVQTRVPPRATFQALWHHALGGQTDWSTGRHDGHRLHPHRGAAGRHQHHRCGRRATTVLPMRRHRSWFSITCRLNVPVHQVRCWCAATERSRSWSATRIAQGYET